MESDDRRSMSIDELWKLYEEVTGELRLKIADEKAKLERRLQKIESPGLGIRLDRVRRPYPKVLPKYQNPKNPAETWSGRGKTPRWLKLQLTTGKKVEDFLIGRLSSQKRRRTG
jgi:DNA-binding protein H-NS